MSTHATISIKLRKSDIGKIMKFDNNMLPKGFRYDGEKEQNLEVMPCIELKKQYLTIYCHFDG